MLRSLGIAALLSCLWCVPAHAEIRLLDAETGSVATPVRDELTTLIRWSDDGSALLVLRGARAMRVDLRDGSVARQPLLDDAASVGPGGLSVRLRGLGDPAVELRAPDGHLVATQSFPASIFDPSIAWSPDGSRVALASGGELVVLDTASGAAVVRRRTGRRVSVDAFAPDASAIALSDGPRVLRIDLPSAQATVVFRARDRYQEPRAAWGPGERIAVTLDDRIRVLGTPSVALRPRGELLGAAFWRPGADSLTYVFGRAPDACSYLRHGVALVVPGRRPRVLLRPSGAEVRGAAWSPDGRTLALDLGPDYAAELERRGRRHPWPKRIATDYAMLSPRGNAAMRRIVVRAARRLRRGAGREWTLRRVRLQFHRIAARFPEADDTVVREAVGDELDKWLRAAGFARIEAYDEITC